MNSKSLLLLFLLCLSHSAQAQVYAHLKLRDAKLRYPKLNEIEFPGTTPTRATYDALYGHGAVCENEYVAFRVYMDHRQSLDLYGKRRPQLELDSTNFYTDAHWRAKGYGEDILYAGTSVAAGSFRGWEDGHLTYIEHVGARGQRILKAGPDTAQVEVWDKDWQTNGKTLQMRQVYTMIRGKREMQVDIFLEGADDKDLFVTGVQKLEMDNEGFLGSRPKSRNRHRRELKGLAASWGCNVPEKGHPEIIHGVGLGVYVPSLYLHHTQEDDLNYLCFVHPVDGHIRYYISAYAWMQEENGFAKAEDWFGWLEEWAASMIKL